MPTTSANLDPRNNLDSFVQSLLRRFDTNGDNQLALDEFSSLLSRVLGEASTTGRLGSTGQAGAGATRAVNAEMTGFDFEKMDTASTLKYRFARVARNYDLAGVHDNQSAEALLRQMMPELQQEGLSVLEISNDKIRVRQDDGTTGWIDVIRSVGGAGTAWQWLDQNVR